MTRTGFDCANCKLRKCEAFQPLDREHANFLTGFRLGEMRVDAGREILKQGVSSPHFYTLYDGWAARRVTLEDGRSQITNFGLAGTLLGLQAALENDMDHSVEALTDVTLCVFARSDFRRLLEKQPDLSFRVLWQAAREERFLDGNLLAVGRKQAHEKIAYLFASLHERACRSGMIKRGGALDIPITQQHVADAMGLSIAHTQRVIREFVVKEYIRPNRGRIGVLDAAALAEIGQFDPKTVLPSPLL